MNLKCKELSSTVLEEVFCLFNNFIKNVRKISFTGSTEIGKLIQEYAAASSIKRVSLGLSGKSPLILLDDNHELSKAYLIYLIIQQ